MPLQTALTRRLGIDNPIILAPMAGGPGTPDLVAAVSNAGGLGFAGLAYLTPAQIAEFCRSVRERTQRPFGINLFAALPPKPVGDGARVAQIVAPFFAELGLAPPTIPAPAADSFNESLEAALAGGASILSFTFGILPTDALQKIKSRMFVMGTATTVDEAQQLEAAGVDAVIAQGSEAGAHRGTFAHRFEEAMIGTMALVPQVVDAVKLPVVASGGIMDGRGVAAAFALGATAVQSGTCFLTCNEAGIPEAYKQAILHAREYQTRVTRAFSGRPARGIVNRFMTEVENAAGPDGVLPYPVQNTLTRPLRAAAAKAGRAEFLSLWAGQAFPLARRQPAADLVRRMMKEAEEVIKGMSQYA